MNEPTRSESWKVLVNLGSIYPFAIKDSEGVTVALVDSRDEARLIAAAPEMLETLKRQVHWLWAKGFDSQARELRRTIEKAEGRA